MNASLRKKTGWIAAGLWGAYTADLLVSLSTESRRGLPPELSLLALVGACTSTVGWLIGLYSDQATGQVEEKISDGLVTCREDALVDGVEVGLTHRFSLLQGGAADEPAPHPAVRRTS